MSQAITSRDRVLAALNHRETDRVPLDLSGHRSSGISAIAYARLRKHLALPQKPVRIYDPVQQLAIVDEDVLDLFHVDAIELGRAFALEDSCWHDWELPDGTPCQLPAWVKPEMHAGQWVIRSASGRIIAKMPPGVLFFEQAYYPFAERENLDDLAGAFAESMWHYVASPPGPLAGGPDGIKLLAAGAKRLRAQTQRAVIGLFGGNLLETGQMLYRNDQFLMLLAAEPERAHAFLDALVEIHMANLERFLGAVGGHIDVILFGDDLGMQGGPQISPAMYRRFFKPRHKRMWERAKQLAPVKVMLHCCGGVKELLPDLIDAGLDAINPVQITCKGMDPQGLKSEFGKDLVFWGGGCDTRSVLPSGSPGEVREHVRQMIDIWRGGGGFVFQQVHNIMANVPPENIVAMLEAAGEP
jgi:uroporphyrinogen decarboxylase